jgi:cell division protein FtsA
MKVQFGMALADEANANAYITIPGLRGMPSKEISMKNLAHIIQARMQEILDYVVYHLKQIDLEKRLYGGIILTGGGAQLKHLVQLTEYVTGLGARLGYPNEHIAGGHAETLMNPMYSTCIGLILRGYHDFETGKLIEGEGNDTFKYASVDMPVFEDNGLSTADISQEEMTEEIVNRNNRRTEQFRRLFEGLKGKFMSFFEEVEDEEIQ